MTTERIFIYACGLIAAVLSACGGPVNTQTRDDSIERVWEPLIESCDKGEISVTCPTPIFKQQLYKVVDLWEYAANCQIERQKCLDLAAVDKRELEAKVFGLQAKLDDWWRLPIVWAAVGILAGFGLGAGLMGVFD